jgi:hypothetical protein
LTTAAERSQTPSAFRREKPPSSDAAARTRWGWAVDLALALPAIFILVGWLIVAIAHIDDRYEVGHGQGTWMALARQANVSGLYPELFDGTSYGGTRHMPLPILAHAALARLTGEYLTSGKLLGLLATAGMVIVTFTLLRSIGCRWSWALALSALAVGGFAGLRAGTTIGGEPLPVMLGVGALAVVIRSRRHPALIAAAVLTALGISAKLSALWAPAAIVAWLFFTDRRRAAPFAAYAAGATALLLGAFDVVSDGRMIENLAAVWGAGVHGPAGILKAPARLLDFVVDGEPAVWALIPVLAYAAATKRFPVRASIFPMAWLAAALILVVVLADIGTGPNQLIDLAVLTALCAGAVVAFANLGDARDRLLVSVLAAILVWSGITAFVVHIRPPLQDALSVIVSGSDPYPRNVLKAEVSSAGSVLSEDPGVLVENGHTPVVFDPFMLTRLADTHPAAVEQLVRRIENREFDLVVLVVASRDPHDPWWHDYHFGTEVITAVYDAYRFDRRVGAYSLYRPIP